MSKCSLLRRRYEDACYQKYHQDIVKGFTTEEKARDG
jgi:hypothetical protein